LEATFGAIECREGGRDALEIQAYSLTNGHRGKRVLEVVPAGHRKLETAEHLDAIRATAVHHASPAERAKIDVGGQDVRIRVIEPIRDAAALHPRKARTH